MLLPLAETPLVRVWAFSHHGRVAGDPGEEVFLRPTMVFTSAGRWQVTSAAGRGVASPAAVVLGNPGQAYRCRHDHGFTDRNLVLEFRQAGRSFPAGLAPVDDTMHRLLRQLRRALARPAVDQLATDSAAAQLRAHAAAPTPACRWPPWPGWTTPCTGCRASSARARSSSAVREHIERHFADPACRWPPWPGWPAGAPATSSGPSAPRPASPRTAGSRSGAWTRPAGSSTSASTRSPKSAGWPASAA